MCPSVCWSVSPSIYSSSFWSHFCFLAFYERQMPWIRLCFSSFLPFFFPSPFFPGLGNAPDYDNDHVWPKATAFSVGGLNWHSMVVYQYNWCKCSPQLEDCLGMFKDRKKAKLQLAASLAEHTTMGSGPLPHYCSRAVFCPWGWHRTLLAKAFLYYLYYFALILLPILLCKPQ